MREFEFEPSPGLPDRTFLGVYTLEELHGPSGIDGMTNLEFIEFLEGALHRAQGIFLNNNGHMPREAHDYNRRLKQQGEEPGPRSAYAVAVYSRRPPTL